MADAKEEPKRRWSLSNLFKGKPKPERHVSMSSISDDEFGFGGEFGVFKPPPPRRNTDADIAHGLNPSFNAPFVAAKLPAHSGTIPPHNQPDPAQSARPVRALNAQNPLQQSQQQRAPQSQQPPQQQQQQQQARPPQQHQQQPSPPHQQQQQQQQQQKAPAPATPVRAPPPASPASPTLAIQTQPSPAAASTARASPGASDADDEGDLPSIPRVMRSTGSGSKLPVVAEEVEEHPAHTTHTTHAAKRPSNESTGSKAVAPASTNTQNEASEQASASAAQAERLAAARKAAAAAADAFALESDAQEEERPARRGLPSGSMLPGRSARGPPPTDMEEMEEAGTGEDADDDQPPSEDPPEPEKELTFEEIMDKAMEIERSEKNEENPDEPPDEAPPQPDGAAEENVNDKPIEDWEVFQAIVDDDKDEIEALAQLKANFNCRDDEGFTPLLRAIDRNKPLLVEALIAGGSDINAQTQDGLLWTPLHMAALNGYAAIVDLLLKAGADTTKLDSRQETALQWAEANKEEECIKLLKKAGAK